MKYSYKRILVLSLFIFAVNSRLNGQIIEKTNCSDRWFGKDKLAHFAVSLTTVGFTNHWLGFEKSKPPNQARNTAIGFAFSLGLLKEMVDGTKRGNHFSGKDLAADVLGIFCGSLLFTLN